MSDRWISLVLTAKIIQWFTWFFNCVKGIQGIRMKYFFHLPLVFLVYAISLAYHLSSFTESKDTWTMSYLHTHSCDNYISRVHLNATLGKRSPRSDFRSLSSQRKTSPFDNAYSCFRCHRRHQFIGSDSSDQRWNIKYRNSDVNSACSCGTWHCLFRKCATHK